MALGRRNRNEVFEVLRRHRVDPADCDLNTSAQVIRLHHKPTGSDFRFMDHGDVWVIDFLVEDGPNHVGLRAGTWDELLDQLTEWALEARYVTETADFWEELRRAPEILAAAQSADASNEPFTADEQAEISTRIDQVKDVVRRENPELTAEQISAVEETLEEVKEASTRVGRKDWVMLTNGALLSLIVNDLVPTHVLQSVFNMLITGIGHLFGIGGPPPVIST